jgi:anti-sigma regulatory factor (Ser/Thr protein kinase)
MSAENTSEYLLTAFDRSDAAVLAAAFSDLGHSAMIGDPVNDQAPACVFAAAYDESSLRGQRAAALEDPRPWCFCVPAADRTLVAAASAAREGRVLLLPPERRELKRLIAAISDEARETARMRVFFSGLARCEAEFEWKTSDIDVSSTCRRLARLLREAGFYRDRAEEDQCALALEEAMVNSIEHGNLGLDSSLRPNDYASEDLYEAERERRLADPDRGGKLIRLSLRMSAHETAVVIEDQGDGFDTSILGASPEGLDVSGKGYWLIKRPFDTASYNERGNVLTLVKKRPPVGDGS